VSAHVLELLSVYLDGELSAAARSEVEAHLRGCPGCARHLEELAAVDAAARELPVPAPPGYFDALPARVRARLPAPRRRTPPVWAWAAAAGLALAALAPLLFRQTASPLPEAAPTEETASPAPPPSTTTTAVPAEAPLTGGERARTAADAPKDAVRRKAVPPAPTPPPALYERARENASAAAPPPSGQVQKRAAPWAQAPAGAPAAAAAARAEGTRATNQVPEEQAPATSPKETAPREVAPEAKLERDQAQRGGLAGASTTLAESTEEAARFRDLLAQRPTSASEERQLHDTWRAFAAAYPSSRRADEARVRAIEALARAWSKSGDPADQAGARKAALDYLATPEAPQRERVRAVLDRLASPRP
jgi:hypothetical protein